jgi:AcrR family transcriptional regulator
MHGHRKPTRTQVITGYRRDALLQAATRIFGKYGFDCATMEQIAQEADVAKGTTYLYYRSKQSIYDAALSRGLAELDDWTREALDRAPNLHDAIAAFVTARAEYFLEHRDFFRMYVAAISRQITSVKPRASEFQAMVDRQTRRLEDAIRRGVAHGEIRHVDSVAAALAIFDLTRGLVARCIMATRAFDVASEAAFVTSLVWAGLGLEREKRLRPERGAGGKRREAAPPSESAWGWGPTRSKKS